LRSMLFCNYEAVLYLRQMPHPHLTAKARDIAAYLELPLEINDVGMGELEDRLAALVESANPATRPSAALPTGWGGE
jgi:hypothetical protein